MEKRINIPNFFFCWQKYSNASEIKVFNKRPLNNNGLYISFENFFPKPFIQSNKNYTIIVIGSTILSEKISFNITEKHINNNKLLREINGEFIIIFFDKKKRKIKIINDRFSSYPVYYVNTEKLFFLSSSYLDLIKNLQKKQSVKIVKDNFFEFIFFQRLLGDKTYDYSSKYLSSGTILNISKQQFSQKKFWVPNFSKTKSTDNQLVDEMVFLLKQSLKRKTSDKKNYGLFLSGGFDSRSVAIAAETHLTCLTYSFNDNYEVNCARKSAEILGNKFVFLKFPKFHLSKSISLSNSICNGMYVIDNALFTLPPDYQELKLDVMLNGHGFDYMFQGMYLPTENFRLFGRPTFFKKLLGYDKNISMQFMKSISFRLKYFDLFDFLHEKFKKYFFDFIFQSCEEIRKACSSYSQKNSDVWEYFIIHSIGRHYSWPNLGSQNLGIELRTPTFDNDLFNFYMKLNPNHRLSARIFRKALIKMNKECSMIESGNYGIALAGSPLYKTSHLIYRKILRHLTNNQNFRTTHAEDRTWPDRDRYLSYDQDFFSLVENAINSDLVFEYLPYFDWKKIRKYFELYKKRPELQMGSFLVTILSLKKFLEKV